MRLVKTLIALLCVGNVALAQTSKPWNGKQCAVVLTYDDGLQVHLDKVIPALDSLNFKGTFYLAGSFPGVTSRLSDWKRAGEKGHELGNHTLFHPCAGGPGREWVKPANDLNTYTLARIVDETRMTNTFLQALDGPKKRTFAFPCGDRMVEGKPYYESVKADFVAARGVKGELVKAATVDLANVGSYMMSGQSGEQMIDLVKQAMASGSALVFLFHGVGGEHSLNVALPEHAKLLRYLKQHEADIWVAPFVDVAESIRGQQSGTARATR